jgi:hypothetical protein
MTPKLSKEEYEALLESFDVENFKLRKLAAQSHPFRVAYLVINIYSIGMMLLYFIVTQFFLENVNQDLLENGYVNTVGTRAFLFFWMIFLFNVTFYFGLGFRVMTSVMLLYTINVTFEHAFTLFSTYTLAEMPILTPYLLSRPILILTLAFAVYTYRDA